MKQEMPYWCQTFGLDQAYSSRLVLEPKDAYDKPYGKEMIKGLEAKADGYLIYQDKPLAVFIAREDEAEAICEIKETLWDALWNQGLASVLVLHLPTKIAVYSLFNSNEHAAKGLPSIIDEINISIQAYKAQELIRSLEDGNYLRDEGKHLPIQNRVDRNLLGNLLIAREKLVKLGLCKEEAQNLLLQILFIAYLEDRDILPEQDFLSATHGKYSKLEKLLQSGDIKALDCLFSCLSTEFNGDVFSSPCSFTNLNNPVVLQSEHLQVLAGLRRGDVDTRGHYQLFRRYNFKYIPISLLSAIYDRFQEELSMDSFGNGSGTKIKQSLTNKRKTGSYFTPARLAQVCTSLAWKHINLDNIPAVGFTVLDPACGSAVFLVCVFQRIIGRVLALKGTVDWPDLISVLKCLHGCDVQSTALHVGIISLYIALLEYMEPPAIFKLRRQGKMLPQLYNVSMLEINFFKYGKFQNVKYDLIIGNPPWLSRQGDKVDPELRGYFKNTPFLKFIPNTSPTWGFIWKCGEMLKDTGVSALLINAAHVFGANSRKSMSYLYSNYTVPQIVNFSDACFQLFDGSKAPAALCIYKKRANNASNDRESTFFCSPKANPDYHLDQRIVLAPDDHFNIRQSLLAEDPALLIPYKWARSRDFALLDALQQLYAPLSERIHEFKSVKNINDNDWVIGQGLNPGKGYKRPRNLDSFDYWEAKAEDFRWHLPYHKFPPPPDNEFGRLRIIEPIVEGELVPPFILLKQGADRRTGQLQASYSEKAVIFSKSLQAIASPAGKKNDLIFKVLTGVLNSRLAAWFSLHLGSVVGIERYKLLQNELLKFPFPLPSESPHPHVAISIANEIDKIAYSKLRNQPWPFNSPPLHDISPATERRINEYVYEYYGLSLSERQLVEDSFDYILPSIQPSSKSSRKRKFPPLWDMPDTIMLESYMHNLKEALSENYHTGKSIRITTYFEPTSSLVVAEACMHELGDNQVCSQSLLLQEKLEILKKTWPQSFAQGIHWIADMIFAVDRSIYIVKPNRVKYWMPTAGLCDADRILADLRK